MREMKQLITENDLLRQEQAPKRRGLETAHNMVTDLLCCGNCIHDQRNLCEIKPDKNNHNYYCKNWRTDGMRNHNRLIVTDIVK